MNRPELFYHSIHLWGTIIIPPWMPKRPQDLKPDHSKTSSGRVDDGLPGGLHDHLPVTMTCVSGEGWVADSTQLKRIGDLATQIEPHRFRLPVGIQGFTAVLTADPTRFEPTEW